MTCIKCMCRRMIAAFVCVFVFIVVCDVSGEELQCSRRHILKSNDLPEPFYDTCKFMSEGQNLTSSDCTIWDIVEELPEGGDNAPHDCSNLKFTPSADGSITGIEIYPVADRVPFKIGFRNMQWHYIQYRIQAGLTHKGCHKLMFDSAVELQPSLHIIFDCHWFGSWAAGFDAELLMDMGHSSSDITSHGHFIMKVPANPSNETVNIKDWLVLVVVDISHKPDLHVYWPAVPNKYNVTKYNVQIGSDKPKEVDQSSCPNGYCSIKMFAGYASRNISVSVQPVHKECHRYCISSSPIITLEFSLPGYFMAMMVVMPILVVLLVICFVYFFCCAAPREPVNVLLLYDATTEQHFRVVRILAEYLRQVGQVHCLIDMVEIPKTNSQNPSKWLHKTLDEAEAVVYVASPSSHLDIRYSEYPNVVYEALLLIQKQRSCPAHIRPGHFLVVMPPYCTKENIPECLQDVPRFHIPRELSWLLWSLYNQQCWMAPFTWIAKAYLRCCCCPGPMLAYHKYGTRLREALSAAIAKHTLDEQRPTTPLSARHSIWTRFNNRDDENDNMSMPYIHFPGPLNALPLLGKPMDADYEISEGSLGPGRVVNLNKLPL